MPTRQLWSPSPSPHFPRLFLAHFLRNGRWLKQTGTRLTHERVCSPDKRKNDSIFFRLHLFAGLVDIMTGCERSNVATTSGKRPRTISNLTQEQIQHKRNVDRKAQRAFRQRTKDCIKNLEQEFAQLQETCTHKDQELQAVREHNETLVHCLENILELVSATLRQSRHVDNDGPGFGRRSTKPNPQQLWMYLPILIKGIESLGSGQENESEQPDPEPSSAARQLRPRTPDVEELPSEPITTAATPAETPQSQLGSAFGALPTPCSTLMPMASHLIVPTSVSVVIPSHLPPTCPLDKILLDFKASRRDLLAEGMAPDILAGPPRPTMKALIDSELVDSVHPLSGIMSQVLSTFPYVHMTEKLAFFYLMYHTTRVSYSPVAPEQGS